MRQKQLYPKAYFLWLKQTWEIDPAIPTEPWQIEDYRELSTAMVFERLAALGLSLDADSFFQIAENFKSPEELTHHLCPDKTHEFQIYLLLFELWRRLVPDKQSLSVFCDELDHRIKLYNLDPNAEVIHLQNSIQRIEEILEENCDAGETPKSAFTALERHVAHDLEGFLYDYITDQINAQSDEAIDLLDSFYPYMSQTLWFDFLKARLLILGDTHEGNLAFQQLLTQELNIDLLLEIGAFLVHHGDPSLFQKTAQLALNEVETEVDFQELLATVGDYCHFVEKEAEELQIETLFIKRLKRSSETPLDPQDPDMAILKKILANLQRTEI